MIAMAAVILAGGRSSRMGGGDKSLIELAGKPMLAMIVNRLRPQADQLAINANGDPARFVAFGLPVLADATQTFDGPLAGVLAALHWAGEMNFERVLTVAGDTPFFPENLASRLASAGNSQAIVIAASRGRAHPAFALWPTSLAPNLRRELANGLRRVTGFVERHPSVRVAFPDVVIDDEPVDPFFNINTPEDLAEARRIANKLGA